MTPFATVLEGSDGALDPIAIEVRGVDKWFGATHALRSVDLTIRAGRVHALLGANGCGKSTLVKILSGYHQPDAGEIVWAKGDDGAIAFVHQDLGLIPTLSVTENLALSAGFVTRGGMIDWRAEHRRVDELLTAHGIDSGATTLVGSLGPAEQTMVAIARAVAHLPETHGILVLDEPTARLPASEAKRLLDMIRQLRRRGVAILYISHRLDEVYEIGDDVTVLRDGARVFDGRVADLDRGSLVRLIVGRDIDPMAHSAQPAEAALRPVLVSVNDVSANRLRNVSFNIREGEIVGIAGLVGSGRSELGRVLFGLQEARGGTVTYRGEDATGISTGDAVERGIGYVPQERREGIFGGLSVAENAIAADFPSVMGRFGIASDKVLAAAEDVVRWFAVKTAGVEAPIESLSGGNQQKVSLAKWFRRDIRFIILDEPTQGIDIGARTEIFRIIRRMAEERGIGALVLDSDLEILAEHCDRVLVMTRGRVTREIGTHELSPALLSHEVYGS